MPGYTRRETLKYLFAAGLALKLPLPGLALAREAMPTRPIPATGEALPVIGLGNSRAFRSGDYATSRTIVRILVEHGGRVIDTLGRSTEVLGRIMEAEGLRDKLFLGTNIETGDRDSHLEQVNRSRELQGKDALDLLFVTTLEGINTQWPLLREWKEKGYTRYIGVALIGRENFPALEVLMETGTMDFIQVNYSMLEPEADDRILPLAQERGIAVINNRPFINGNYFKLVKDKRLPDWAADFDCDSWAQFSLKWILANPAVNCVLTETANPEHARDNLSAAYGRLPDEQQRKRMAALIRSL
ncbi:MAG: aldo/keto reductase [Gammaproteobacteria bacterium]